MTGIWKLTSLAINRIGRPVDETPFISLRGASELCMQFSGSFGGEMACSGQRQAV